MNAALDSRSEMQALLHRVAGEAGSVKVRINRAARKCGLSFNRAKDIWYADHRISIKADELEKARAAVLTQAQGAKDEISDLKARVEALESVLLSLVGGERGASELAASAGMVEGEHPRR